MKSPLTESKQRHFFSLGRPLKAFVCIVIGVCCTIIWWIFIDQRLSIDLYSTYKESVPDVIPALGDQFGYIKPLNNNTAVQNKRAVSADITSKEMQPFKFTKQHSMVEEKPQGGENSTKTDTQQMERQADLKRVCRRLKTEYYHNSNYYKAQENARLLTDHYHRIMFCLLKKVSSSSWMDFFKLMIVRERDERDTWLSSHSPRLSRDKKRISRLTWVNKSGFDFVTLYRNKNSSVLDKKKYFKCIMVRHPLDRLASAYLNRVVDQNVNNTMNFEEFLEGASLFKKTDPHWMPFITKCMPCSARFDYIIHTETLHTDLEVILKQFNLTEMVDDFPQSNPGLVKSVDYKDMYANVSKAVLRDVFVKFQPDADMFGYSFEGYGAE